MNASSISPPALITPPALPAPAGRQLPRPGRLALGLAVGALLLAARPGQAQTEKAPPPAARLPARTVAPPVPPAPSLAFADLEAAGAVIGEIRIVNGDIFDLDDPQEDRALFRLANRLHIQTRQGVIERALLFKRGEPLQLRLIDETERLLRDNRYLHDVQIRPLALHDGIVDIEVLTRDTWSLDPGISAGRSGGSNSGGIHLKEYNLLGTGIALSLGHSKNVDRSSNEFQFSNERAFGSWTSLAFSHASNSDGRRDAVSVVRPFYALDARWAAGFSASKDDRIDAVYNAGKVASQYRHREDKAELFGGWSTGLVDGWVQRYSAGISLQDDRFAAEPGLAAPAALPADQRLVAPFLRYELIEDRYEREVNRNLIGRPEFFALGLNARVQLGWAGSGLGSSEDALLYAATLSRGFEPAPGHRLITAASLGGRLSAGQVRRQRLGAQAQYYLPQGKRWLFYASATGAMLTRPNADETLLLGGEDGLRGYPLRYQGGTRRVLFTVEERAYTDLYLWRLFRFGGAAFVDAGRAWGGPNVNLANPGWLGNVGMGLRIVSTRAAFSNVLHIDIAMPLNSAPDIKKLQFLVKTRTSF